MRRQDPDNTIFWNFNARFSNYFPINQSARVNDRGEPAVSYKWTSWVWKITDHFRRIYRVYPNLKKENWRMSTYNRLELQTLGSQQIMPKNLPDHWPGLIYIESEWPGSTSKFQWFFLPLEVPSSVGPLPPLIPLPWRLSTCTRGPQPARSPGRGSCPPPISAVNRPGAHPWPGFTLPLVLWTALVTGVAGRGDREGQVTWPGETRGERFGYLAAFGLGLVFSQREASRNLFWERERGRRQLHRSCTTVLPTRL